MSDAAPQINLEDRFVGCLLGLAVGDALGASFEARSPEHIHERFPNPVEIIRYPSETIFYTDDTQMAIGIAETLIIHREIIQEHLCKAFVENYVPARGYGRGARRILDAMEAGEDYVELAEKLMPGGSLGNGAAMRIAPLGLFFRDDLPRLLEQASLASLPTHRHPLGIEGAQLIALAAALASQMTLLHKAKFFDELLAACQSEDYRARLQLAASIERPEQLAQLGNGIKALESVVTAIASFALTPESYELTVTNLIYLGGDTDTMAAMAGALSGAYLGSAALPERLLDLLEEHGKGRTYITELAKRLCEVHLEERTQKEVAR